MREGGGLEVGLGLWGQRGDGGDGDDQEGCALIGLGAKVGDIHRGVRLPTLGCS